MRNIYWLFVSFILISCQPEREAVKLNLFEELSPLITQVDFQNNIPESASMNSFVYEYYYNGGGVAIGDVNQDGLEDIFFTSNLDQNALYLNTGDMQFLDVSKKSGIIGKEGWSTGVSMVDINSDGKLDIYVCYSGPFQDEKLRANELYINQGNSEAGHPIFEEVASDYGLADISFSSQAAYLDYDLDGDLDMFLMNHNPSRIPEDKLVNGRTITDPVGDKFYENVRGKFVDKTREVGIYSNAISYGLGIGIGDINQDGWPDIYISNDYEEMDYLYLNQKNKTFKETVKSSTRHISNFSMGNDVADYDNDGYLDIVVLDMVSEDNYGIKTSMPSMNPALFDKRLRQGFHHQYMYNTLQRNTSYVDANGIPHFTDAGRLAGITNTGWSWAPLMADFDNDGNKDVFISNGIKRDFRNNDFNVYLKKLLSQDPNYMDNARQMEEVLSKIPQKPLKNYFYKNNGDLSFNKATEEWLPGSAASLSNGAAYADLDNDGDLDLVVNNMDAKATILRNNCVQNHITVKYLGSGNNPEGIGAKLYAWVDGEKQFFENYRVRGFQSSMSAKTIVGLGENEKVDSLFVEWPDGTIEKQDNIAASSTIVFNQSKAYNSQRKLETSPTIIDHAKAIEGLEHYENEYDDYRKQILLPHKLSQFGPAVAIADINNDGYQDIFLGQSSGSVSGIWVQSENGDFIVSQQFEKHKASEDIDALFFDFDGDGDEDLFVVSGGNEFVPNHVNYADRLYANENGHFVDMSHLLPPRFESGSTVKACDYDKDGRLDLFVGVRHIPGNYPSPASSYLLKNTTDGFVDVSNEAAPELTNLGLVTDAVWSDFDDDEDMDLLVVGEWMNPVVLSNANGKFRKKHYSLFDSLAGWYNSIQPLDIDKDGDLDYLLGNLGENYKYKATTLEPFEVHYADFDNNGSKDIVLGYYNFGELYPVRGRQCSSQQIPELKSEFTNYHSFGSSTLADIYSVSSSEGVLSLKAYNFSSGVLKNVEGDFEFISFENLAQLSSVNDFLVRDFNKDGHQDLLICGNLYSSEIETPRNDAGYGLILIGDHEGNFKAMDSDRSGFYVNGEVRKLSSISIGKQDYILSAANKSELLFHHITPTE